MHLERVVKVDDWVVTLGSSAGDLCLLADLCNTDLGFASTVGGGPDNAPKTFENHDFTG